MNAAISTIMVSSNPIQVLKLAAAQNAHDAAAALSPDEPSMVDSGLELMFAMSYLKGVHNLAFATNNTVIVLAAKRAEAELMSDFQLEVGP